MAQPVKRHLPRTISTSRFATIALVNLALLWLIVPSGALVRLTASGLGCPDWPLCNGGVVPATGAHAIIEYTNRVFSAVVMVVTLITWLASRRSAPRGSATRRLAGSCALMTVGQVPLGALTVLSGLHPLMVAGHFVLSLAALAAGTLLALAANDAVLRRTRGWCRRRGPLVIVGAIALLATIVTGVLVTSAGPHSGDPAKIDRFGDLQTAAWIHVRAVGVLIIIALVLAVWLWREAPADPLARRFCGLTVLALAVQVGIGEYQYRHELPWQVVVAHVSVAGIVWALAITAGYRIARPTLAAVTPVGERVDRELAVAQP